MKKGRGDQDMNKKAWKAGAVSALAVGAGLAAAVSKRKKAGKVVEADIPVHKINAILFELEMKGVVRVLAGGMYQLLT